MPMNENKQVDSKAEQSLSDIDKEKKNTAISKQNAFWAKTLTWIFVGLAGLAIVILIFCIGMFVGEKKAGFSYRWAESYHQNFGGPRGGFLGDWQKLPLSPGDFTAVHGLFGQIIKTDPSTGSGQVPSIGSGQTTLIIKGGDGVEKIVLVKDNTLIRRFRETVKPADLKVDDYIVVIGEPNDSGQIEAKFIRLMPPLPEKTSFEPFPSGPFPLRQRWQ